MIGKALLIAENVGRVVLIWQDSHSPMEGTLKAWSQDWNSLYIELQKDYGKGRREGDLVLARRDICSFRQLKEIESDATSQTK
jgi:hypothetical protein